MEDRVPKLDLSSIGTEWTEVSSGVYRFIIAKPTELPLWSLQARASALSANTEVFIEEKNDEAGSWFELTANDGSEKRLHLSTTTVEGLLKSNNEAFEATYMAIRIETSDVTNTLHFSLERR